MKMRLKHVRDKWANVPAKWAAQYAHGRYPDKNEITRKLAALAPDELTGERIEAIMNGNTSWTRQHCDICGLEKETLCQLGDDPDYESQWVDVCLSCLKDAIAKFEAV